MPSFSAVLQDNHVSYSSDVEDASSSRTDNEKNKEDLNKFTGDKDVEIQILSSLTDTPLQTQIDILEIKNHHPVGAPIPQDIAQ
ncbi:hypothetical protein ACH5RR_021490 [Cinchona calisaya]|uniref:Uncharacterized protein n=1 Tax=Cinchona calisaya TaxID=153742 RepID=A0ABD2ZHF2_9GENT